MHKNNRVNSLDQLFDQLFDSGIQEVFGSQYIKSKIDTNFFETEEGYVYELALPGVKKESIDLKLEEEHIHVSVIENNDSENQMDKMKRKEFDFNSASRKVSFPKNADRSTLKAKYALGILTIALSKRKESKKANKRIEIK